MALITQPSYQQTNSIRGPSLPHQCTLTSGTASPREVPNDRSPRCSSFSHGYRVTGEERRLSATSCTTNTVTARPRMRVTRARVPLRFILPEGKVKNNNRWLVQPVNKVSRLCERSITVISSIFSCLPSLLVRLYAACRRMPARGILIEPHLPLPI